MKTTSLHNEADNVVLFPSSKNFSNAEETFLEGDLAQVLEEYARRVETDIPSNLDGRFQELLENDLEDSSTFDSLEAFMNRHQSKDTITPDDKLVKFVRERLEAIHKTRLRIKFYLDEIEMFLPRKH